MGLEDSWGGEEWERRYEECIRDQSISRKEIPALDLMALILKSLYETGGAIHIQQGHSQQDEPPQQARRHDIFIKPVHGDMPEPVPPTVRISSEEEDGQIVYRFQPGDLVVCNLSSINLGRTDTVEKLREVIPVQVRMLDNVITMNHLPLPQAVRTNMRYRAIGIGISGYHQHLAKKGIDWESEEHVRYADWLFEEINYIAIKASMELAKERGAYPLFKGSDWETGGVLQAQGGVYRREVEAACRGRKEARDQERVPLRNSAHWVHLSHSGFHRRR